MWKLEYDPILSVDLLMLDSVASLLHCLAVPPVKRFFLLNHSCFYIFRLLSKNGPWWFLHKDFHIAEVSVNLYNS